MSFTNLQNTKQVCLVHKINAFEAYPDVLDVKGIMSALKINRHAVYGLISSGHLKSFRIGKHYKITKESLVNCVELLTMQGEK